ncbi:DUF3139 domain-containing protein [Macrococcus animalis]|uniref:DUF3139 domain-containing protein n=1 Tax=Macrococcus animalis TaxID=3395467 RepID=UPI0039BE8691
MKKFLKIISISIITIIIFFKILILSLNTINKNNAQKDYAEIQTQLLQKENENNILKNKKVYNAKIGEGNRSVIFKDDKDVEYNVYLTNGKINIEPLFYDIKIYKTLKILNITMTVQKNNKLKRLKTSFPLEYAFSLFSLL